MTSDSGAPNDRETARSHLWNAWRGYAADRRTLLTGSLAAVLAGVCLSSLPLLAGRALDAAISKDAAADRDLALWLGGLFGGLAVLEAVLRALGRSLLIRRSREFEKETKAALHRHLRKVRLDVLRERQPADLVSRLGDDVEQLRFATGPALLHGIQALVVLPLVTVGLVLSDPSLAILALVGAIALGLGLALVTPALKRHARVLQGDLGRLGQRAEHSIAHQRSWRALGRREEAARAIVDSARDLSQTKLRLAFTRARLDLSIHATLETLAVLGLLTTGLAILDGEAQPGDLLQLYATLGIALNPLLTIGALAGALPRAVAAAERLAELRALPTEPPVSSTADLDPEQLRVEGLCAVRSEHAPPIDLDLSLGRRIGIVGPIGSGKSTLLEGLGGIRPLASGDLRAGTIELDLATSQSGRSLFALVDQEPTLWDGTLRENLTLVAPGDRTPDDEAMADALRSAGFDPRSGELPDGLDTKIGEGGITLSGGQRQRVALARALVSERPVLLLDDAFSALDIRTEQHVLESLTKARRTIVLASHRLRSMPSLDEVLILERGRVVDRGTHAELMLRCAGYARSFRLQQEAALLEGESGGAS